jgi:hypothetical protein
MLGSSVSKTPPVVFGAGLALTAALGSHRATIFETFPLVSFDEFAKGVGPDSGPSGALEFSMLLSGPIYLAFYAAYVSLIYALILAPLVGSVIFWILTARRKRQLSLKNEAHDA